jgi:GH15 family glucan-1,4-alpha-glucosidase
VKRYGKLGAVNVWWARGLEYMAQMATAMGNDDLAEKYGEMFRCARASIMEKLYDAEGAYFRAEARSDRLDTVASIFGTLYFLGPEDAARVEEALDRRVRHASGLQNFDPPYPISDIFWLHRYLGQWRYHNEFVWPWVTAQNIFVKLKIGVRHNDAVVRERYKESALTDLALLAKIFEETGGAHEVVHADVPIVPHSPLYRVPKRFMASMVSYQGAYLRMRKVGWI